MNLAEIRTSLFVTALRSAEKSLAELADALAVENDDEISISDLDDVLIVLLEARNEYCAALEVSIERGYIEWQQSEAQKAQTGDPE